MKRPRYRKRNKHGGVTLSENDVAHMVRLIPKHMHHELLGYIEKRQPPSSFLQAVLSNDLMHAGGIADGPNARALADYVGWLYNYAPDGCYGSPETYSEWIQKGCVDE